MDEIHFIRKKNPKKLYLQQKKKTKKKKREKKGPDLWKIFKKKAAHVTDVDVSLPKLFNL